MDTGTSNTPRPRLLERPIVAIAALGLYALVVFGLSSLFYLEFVWIWPIAIVPMAAEIALIRSEWTRGSLETVAISRFIGIAAGEALTYYVYVLHFVFDGTDPYGEDFVLTWILVVIESPIAFGAALVSRRLFGRAQ